MPRMTMKFSGALQKAGEIGIKVLPDLNQDSLYAQLNQHGYWWNSRTKSWEEGEHPHAPTELLNVRVWSDANTVEEFADDVVMQLEKIHFQLMERSEVYICRPPKQLEGRVYLKFLPVNAT